LKNGQLDINGNVCGKNVVGNHLIMVMVNYIGGKKVKIIKIKLDSYGPLCVYSSMEKRDKLLIKEKENK
jgi:hypothetical protein